MTCRTTDLRKLSFALLFLLAVAFARPAMASGDGGCSPIWRLLHHDYEGCSNMAFLSPSNDTRVNLLLLMADLRAARPPVGNTVNQRVISESPLFGWESLASRFSPPGKDTLSNAGTAEHSDTAACSAAPPSGDPFGLAVQAEHALASEERDALVAARRKVQSGCASADTNAAIASAERLLKSPAAKAYARYLEGAAAFWRRDYDAANAAFAQFATAQPAWVRETATYMLGRILINRAQVGAFDEYGSFAANWHADAKIVAAAEAALDRYLQLYPKGVYAQSARGLKRRAYWLAQDTGRLEAEYGALLLSSPDERNISDVDLAQEIDNKLVTLSGAEAAGRDTSGLLHSTNPLLLAMLDLMAMRTAERGQSASSSDRNPAALSIETLRQQKPYFAGQMPLYEYLLAVHAFYIENKPAEVLRILPDAARQSTFSYVQFSRQVLRGMALEALKDRNALGFWQQMLPGSKAPYQRAALELAVAYHEERAGELGDVFAPGSAVRYGYLREVLLVRVADANLLRVQANNPSAPARERDVALFTLLYKEATLGHADDFLKDVALVPANAPTVGYFALDGEGDSYFTTGPEQPEQPVPLGIFVHGPADAEFGCPALRVTEAQLAKDAGNPTARLCVADFVRLHPSMVDTPSSSVDELGDTPSLFPGGNYVRMETYTAVLADAKSSRNDKAYALYRAVNCYAHSGNNSCGGKDVPKGQRKAWFTTLKHDYAGTRWANELEYYW